MSTTARCAALAAVGAMALAGTAQAATKSVYMGVPPANQKAFQKLGADANAFFPNQITIHRGDTVDFVPVGFHDVDLPAKGKAPLPLVAPAGTISGATDPAGVAYWFNGQPNFQFNPALLPPNLGYGKTATYNGKSEVVSGLPLGDNLKPAAVKFTKTGTFTYYCNVHAGMKAKVHVVAPKAKAPSKRSDAKRVSKQVAAALKEAKRLQNPKVAANNVLLGNAGKGGVEVYAFFPAAQTVPVGTTVTFSMSPKSFEAHTATTGPGDPESQPDSFLGKLAGSLEGQIDQAAIYPSDAPPGPASLTPSTHGNGFWGTGFLDSSNATPIPSSGQVKIAAPGTYTFYCLIHPFMKATITAS